MAIIPGLAFDSGGGPAASRLERSFEGTFPKRRDDVFALARIKVAHPLGFCQCGLFGDLCREWAGRPPVWMRQDHQAGERMSVDYAGDTVPGVDLEV